MGRYPMFTRGLGTFSVSPPNLVPRPPQNKTTFMRSSLPDQSDASEHRGGLGDSLESELGPLRDVEQRAAPIRLVEHPEHRQLDLLAFHVAAHLPVEPALSELGLALRILVDVGLVVLQHAHDRKVGPERVAETLSLNEAQVVRRGMVFGIAAPGGSRERAHRKVEARG